MSGREKRTLKEQGQFRQMCQRNKQGRLQSVSGADISISVTGLAGPGGQEQRKPGWYCISWAAAIRARLLPKSSTLQEIACGPHEQTTAHALAMLRDCIIMAQ